MEKELYRRLSELAERAYMENKTVYSSFLSESECRELRDEAASFAYADPLLFGGAEGCTRNVVRFGPDNACGFPVATLKITPKSEKFAEALNHRDYLGALLSLGIQRSTLGDILPDGKSAYLFCLEHIADYICENLTQIRHTDVVCKRSDERPSPSVRLVEKKLFVSSLRADTLACAVYHLSRAEILPYFRNELISLNGKTCTENAKAVKTGDTLAVRGKGKFTLIAIGPLSKKGNLVVTVAVPE